VLLEIRDIQRSRTALGVLVFCWLLGALVRFVSFLIDHAAGTPRVASFRISLALFVPFSPSRRVGCTTPTTPAGGSCSSSLRTV